MKEIQSKRSGPRAGRLLTLGILLFGLAHCSSAGSRTSPQLQARPDLQSIRSICLELQDAEPIAGYLRKQAEAVYAAGGIRLTGADQACDARLKIAARLKREGQTYVPMSTADAGGESEDLFLYTGAEAELSLLLQAPPGPPLSATVRGKRYAPSVVYGDRRELRQRYGSDQSPAALRESIEEKAGAGYERFLIESLHAMRGAEALARLIVHPTDVIRLQARIALDRVAQPEPALDVLVRVLADRNRSGDQVAIRTLGRIGSARAIPALLRVLERRDNTSGEAALALARLQAEEAIAPLARALDSSAKRLSPGAERQLIEAAQAFGDPALIAPLERYAERNAAARHVYRRENAELARRAAEELRRSESAAAARE